MLANIIELFKGMNDPERKGGAISTFLLSRLMNLQFGALIPMYAILFYSVGVIESAARHLSLGGEFYAERQVQWIWLGSGAMLVMILTPMRFIKWLAIPGYVTALALSVASLFVGNEVHQLSFGGISFQPAQMAIATGIMTLSLILEWMDKPREGFMRVLQHPIMKLFAAGAVVAIPFMLVVVIGDMGSAMVWIPMALFVLLNAKIPFRYITLISFVGLALLPVMYYSILPKVSSRGTERISVYLDLLQGKEVDIQNEGYAAHRVGLVVGKAGWRGVGQAAEVEDGSLHARGYVPMNTAHNDYIFAVFAEENGFRGVIILLFAYLILLMSLLFIAMFVAQGFGRLVVIGFISVLLAHIFENIGMCVGLMPITGIPLPFMSYSGTFTVICMAMIGICQSIWLDRFHWEEDEE